MLQFLQPRSKLRRGKETRKSWLSLDCEAYIKQFIFNVFSVGETRNAYRILVGKPEGKRSLGRRRFRCVDKIKMDLREIGWDGVDWIDLAPDKDQWRALVNTVMNLRVP
jgi:hypothetical protein